MVRSYLVRYRVTKELNLELFDDCFLFLLLGKPSTF